MKRLRSPTLDDGPPSKRCKYVIDDDLDHVEDRISQLPEPILLKILSLIPTKDATKTSVLSKTWNSICNSFPVFNIEQTYLQKSESKYEDFANYVNYTITRSCSRTKVISIQKFKLVVRLKHSDLRSQLNADLDRWLNYAVSNNVENLVLHYDNWTTSKQHALPKSFPLFRANHKWLKELDLFRLKFVGSSGLDQIGFSLKKLKLDRVDIDNHALQSLLSNCSSSLEELSIQYCDGFQSVSISSAKLQSVDLYPRLFRVQKIAIEAPNLQFLRYRGRSKNVQASLEASNFNKNIVKELRFYIVRTISAAIMRLIVREFRALEKLDFNLCGLEDNIQISSYNPSSDLDLTNQSKKNVDRLIANCSMCYYEGSQRFTPAGLCKLELESEAVQR